MRVIWWLATVVSVSLISIVLSEQRALDSLDNLSLMAVSPLATGLDDLSDPFAELFEGVVDRGDLVRENQRLKQEVERLQAQLAQQEGAEQRVRELEEALGVQQSRPQEQLLVASVIAQETSGLKRAIAIDRGTTDGVDEGMVVLSGDGSLVGTVSQAFTDFAWVRLLTDPDSTVNAQVESGSGGSSLRRGVAGGDLRRGLVLDMLPSDAQVKQGGLVTTSGLGGNYPQSLLIGEVESVEERPQAPFKKATVAPAVDPSSLETVLVLLSFKPARLEGP